MSTKDEQNVQSGRPFRVLVVTGAYPTAERPHSGTFIKAQVDSLIEAGLEMEIVHPKPGQSTPVRYMQAAWQVFSRTLTKRYDVVHGHYSLWSMVARLQWTTPVVASYLGDDILGTVTADGGYSSNSKYIVAFGRKLCYWVDAVIVKSQKMKAAAGGAQHKISVIPNGINFEQFQPVERAEMRKLLGWDQNRYYVLFANNPKIPVKNFPLAQAAINLLGQRGTEAELVVASGLSHDTVVQYMNASNALILSSVAEGSPNVVKEAMACNVPVVATDVGDVIDVIGRTEGCSVCEHSAESLADGLERALAHTERTTGRQDIQQLGAPVIAQRVIAVYKKVTGRNLVGVRLTKEASNTLKDEMYAKNN